MPGDALPDSKMDEEANGVNHCQPSDIGVERKLISRGLHNYIQLVDNICRSLAPFMSEDEIDNMRIELLAIGQNH